MDVIAFTAVFIFVIIVLGVAIAALLSSTTGKRKEERQTRYLASQPWDAHSANGRGNR